MKAKLTFAVLAWLLLGSALADAQEMRAQIIAELDAIVASGNRADTVRIERLKALGRAQVAAEIKSRLQSLPRATEQEMEHDRGILDGRVTPTKSDMERFRRKNERVSLYLALVAITEQGREDVRWLDDDVVQTLHFGATQEEEYVRGHVLEALDCFRDDMPQPFRDAIVQSLTSTTYWMVGGRLASLGMMPRRDLLAKDILWGFVFNPEQAHPALWANAQQATARDANPEETIFLTLSLNAADALVRHCDLGEVVAAWRPARDPLGRRALSLAVFRKVCQADAAFHAAPAEIQAEAVRLACLGLDDLPETWVAQTGFLVLLQQAVAQGTIQPVSVKAEIRACLLHISELPQYGAFRSSIKAILDQIAELPD